MARTAIYNNWGKTYKAFSQALLNAGKALNQIATSELQDVAVNFLKTQDSKWPHNTVVPKRGQSFGGDHFHPWYSGQLHDSVAVRIADRNRTVSVHYMPPRAYAPNGEPGRFLTPPCYQTMKGVSNSIIGAEEARVVSETRAPYYFLPGVQVQLIVGVPYADKVDQSGRHYGFADNLADELFNSVNTWVDSGGLKRPTVYVDDKGVKVKNKTNTRRV